jgi:ERCC4-type nuclease
MTIISIDFREKTLIEICNTIVHKTNIEDITIESRNLNIGDIFIEPNIIIERKSLNDLASSIIDGRYKEQSNRLSQAMKEEGYKIIYLIEGNLDLYLSSSKITTETIMSCIFSLSIEKGFYVIRTNHINETARHIIQFSKKSSKINSSDVHLTFDNIDGLIKKKKKSQINNENIGIIMLCQIPGISSTMASIILYDYNNNIIDFFSSLKKNSNLLNDFRYSCEKTNKEKKLSKNIIENIKTLLIV